MVRQPLKILGSRGFDTRRGRLLSRRGTSSILVGSDDYYIVDGKAILILFTVWSKLHLLIFPFANRRGAQGTIPKSLDNPNDRIAGATYYPCPETQSPRGINTQTLRENVVQKFYVGMTLISK